MLEQMETTTSSSMKKTDVECSSQITDEVKLLFEPERKLFMDKLKKLREEIKADERSKGCA